MPRWRVNSNSRHLKFMRELSGPWRHNWRAKTLPGDRPSTRFAPQIAYEYVVDGRTYRSEHVAFGKVFWSLAPRRAAAKVARYPAGAQVTVYFNPQRPEEAVLERDP